MQTIPVIDAANPDVAMSDLVDAKPLQRNIKVLLIKPFQSTEVAVDCPPMGLLCLAASLREAFGDMVETKVVDMKLYHQMPSDIEKELSEFDADVVGTSTLNCEANASKKIAELVKKVKPSVLTVIGGPYAHKRAVEILSSSQFDWVVGGPGDRVFPQALKRFFNNDELGTDILGLSYKEADGYIHESTSQDLIEDLDSLPMPDWSYIDFDTYSSRSTMMGMQKGKRYALLFTSRGCPYLCNYCHDIFSKNFKFQSAERILEEIEMLYENHGVNEFQIIDDIFNLHKPRLKKVMHEVHRRWPGKIHFCFPNGVRADIMDEDVLDDLKLGGTYSLAIAVETATPRLQTLVEKHLDIDKTHWVIEQCDKRGMSTTGFFMVGFPTETVEELKATVNFALTSKLTIAAFYTVIPQPGTPLYPIAEAENAETLRQASLDDEEGKLAYRGDTGAASWYERTYDFPLSKYVARTYLRFYFAPTRMWRMARMIPKKSLIKGGVILTIQMVQGEVARVASFFQRLKRPAEVTTVTDAK